MLKPYTRFYSVSRFQLGNEFDGIYNSTYFHLKWFPLIFKTFAFTLLTQRHKEFRLRMLKVLWKYCSDYAICMNCAHSRTKLNFFMNWKTDLCE